MTKEEYLSEKKLLDDQINSANEDIEKIEKELKRIPTESDLVALEGMAGKIVCALGNNLDISPQEKRDVLEMLNVKVLISLEGKVKVEGWFTPESDGFSYTSSSQLAVHWKGLGSRRRSSLLRSTLFCFDESKVNLPAGSPFDQK
jgi:hypothetical protein